MVLVKELAENFGYRSDAEEFRRKIEQSREQTLERDVAEAIAYLDSLIINRRWDKLRSRMPRGFSGCTRTRRAG